MASSSKMRRKKSPTAGTRIVKPLAWVEKYLARAKRKMPALVLPRRIVSYRPRLGRKHRTWGACCITDKTITIATHKYEDKMRNVKDKRGNMREKKETVLVQLNHREILMTLAHELAHLEYDEHGYEQKWYALTIFNTFGLYDVCPHCKGKGKVPARYENE